MGFALGEGDTFAAGLTEGLALFTGAGVIVLAGVAEVAAGGVAALGSFELFTGSAAQPAANMIEKIAINRITERLKVFRFGLLISFASFEQD